MLWTGGKDSSLALLDATRSGYDVCCLATFAPPNAEFLAHPLNVIRVQAEALQVSHFLLEVREPFEQGYERALADLRDRTGVTGVVTGDISEVDGQPNWITARTRAIGMRAHAPLWGHDRAGLLRRLTDAGFSTLISCVDTRWLDASWAGRTLDREAIADLEAIRRRNGMDLCGENGEYHTLVVDGPMFASRLEIGLRTRYRAGSLACVDAREVSLITKEANPSYGLAG